MQRRTVTLIITLTLLITLTSVTGCTTRSKTKLWLWKHPKKYLLLKMKTTNTTFEIEEVWYER